MNTIFISVVSIVVCVILSCILLYMREYVRQKARSDAEKDQATSQSGPDIIREYSNEQVFENTDGTVERHIRSVRERIKIPSGSNVQDFVNTRPNQKFLE